MLACPALPILLVGSAALRMPGESTVAALLCTTGPHRQDGGPSALPAPAAARTASVARHGRAHRNRRRAGQTAATAHKAAPGAQAGHSGRQPLRSSHATPHTAAAPPSTIAALTVPASTVCRRPRLPRGHQRRRTGLPRAARSAPARSMTAARRVRQRWAASQRAPIITRTGIVTLRRCGARPFLAPRGTRTCGAESLRPPAVRARLRAQLFGSECVRRLRSSSAEERTQGCRQLSAILTDSSMPRVVPVRGRRRLCSRAALAPAHARR